MDQAWSAPICYYFQQGMCRFGSGCHYRHEVAAEVRMDTVCWYFQENGWCPHGRNCRFAHIVPFYQYTTSKRSTDQSTCIYFMKGNCRHGDSCSFLHPGKEREIPHQTHQTEKKSSKNRKKKKTSTKSNANEEQLRENEEDEFSTPKDLSVSKGKENNSEETNYPEVPDEKENSDEKSNPQLQPEICQALLKRERKMLKQRIREDQLTITTDDNGEEVYEIEFVASDPDWSYDVKSVRLMVCFPKMYPTEPMEIKCLESDVLPAAVIKTCNNAITAWLKQRFENVGMKAEKGDLAFRPFLRWLDRRLESIFTEGLREYKRIVTLRASGISIWTPEKLKEALQHEGRSDGNDIEKDGDNCLDGAALVKEIEEEENENKDNRAETKTSKNQDGGQRVIQLDETPRGVQLRFKNFQLGDQTASIVIMRARFVLQCERCKNSFDLSLRANVASVVDCPRCSTRLAVNFRPTLLHSISPVIGHLDIESCLPKDAAFIEWHYRLTCLKCDHSIDRKDIQPGKVISFKCLRCFTELRFSFNSLQFVHLATESIVDKSNAQHITLKKQSKDKNPAIREGFPLPNDGACGHYKKSFRWFRFPCCGKAYPCDECHDEATTDGHEMVYANRMICGFCCKEQPFSADRPCAGCSKSMTKTSSRYWEGGKGCRNTMAMSKNENRKYRNLNKTVSRRSDKTKS